MDSAYRINKKDQGWGFFLDEVWIREQKFSAGWIGESDKNDMTPDIYENVKDQKKKLQTQAPAPFLKLKFKKKKGKTKTKRTKTTTGKPPPSYVWHHFRWNRCQVTSRFQHQFFGSNRRVAEQLQPAVCEN